MREIKFRAYYLNKEEKAVHDKAYAEWSTDWEGCSLGYVLDNPDYAVVQYTGYKDKNGVEIYEGDIVTYPSPIAWVYDLCKGAVVFNEGSWRISPAREFKDGVLRQLSRRETNTKLCVIGNIYENSELLEQAA